MLVVPSNKYFKPNKIIRMKYEFGIYFYQDVSAFM